MVRCVADSDAVANDTEEEEEEEEEEGVKAELRGAFLDLWYPEVWEKTVRGLRVYFRVAPACTSRDAAVKAVSRLNSVNGEFLQLALVTLGMSANDDERAMWQALHLLPMDCQCVLVEGTQGLVP